jgi:RHS repeat-associated protein
MFMGKSAVRSKALFGLSATFVVAAMLQAASALAGDTVYYYSSDTVHSEVVVTDQNRNVVERTYYAPYGQVLNRDLRDGPGYTGHEEDPETGLVYMQQRYYCPECGRFLSVDPVGVDPTSGGNFNRYEYASDNPYRYTDPFGLFKCAASASASDCETITSNMNGAIKLIQKAADNLNSSAKFTNRIQGADLGKLVKFLKSDNVVVSLGASKGNEPGGTTPGPAGVPVQVKFDFKNMANTIQSSQYKSNTQNEIAASVAHEGQHAEDVFSGSMWTKTNTYLGYYVSETRAFTTQSFVNQGLGTGSAWGLWSPGGGAPGVDPAAQRGAWYDCANNSGCNWNN